MEQRRLALAFLLSLLLLVAYQELVLKRYRKSAPAQPTEQAPAPMAPPPIEKSAPVAPAGGMGAPAGDGSVVRVETDLVRATITTVGARVLDLELKSYRSAIAVDSKPLDLVEPGDILPLALSLKDGGPTDAGLMYSADRSELRLSGDEKGEVRFTAESSEGLRVEKRYIFSGARYAFDLDATIVGGDGRSPTVGLVLTPMPPEGPSNSRQRQEVALGLAGNRLVQKPVTGLDKTPVPLDEAAWAGFATQYFLWAAMPAEGTGRGVISGASDVPVVRLDVPATEGRAAFTVYAGPKDRDILASTGHQLDRALDFGWFWFVAIPLLQALRLLHGITGNYGVAIIVLTALVKVVTIPLTRTTFRNMREMQKIQPQMAKLRERFKDDQVALQKEMMELYRRHRVNPLSGCLPMLLQLPIFVGLYNALSHAIELRHAPFALWIKDLSAPEWLVIGGVSVPVLTILMGASMFLQQWLTPQQGDPAQQRVMMFMPLIFTFMFINFPAGLVLYWLVNNVLTIGQQYFLMRSAT